MTKNEAINKSKELDNRLKKALSSMEKKEDLYQIKEEIKQFQKVCPHNENFTINKYCPWCGKKE